MNSQPVPLFSSKNRRGKSGGTGSDYGDIRHGLS
jgi:hypothetical protein